MRNDIIQAYSKGIQVPSSRSEISSHNMNNEESMTRPRLSNVMPQLDGPASVRIKRKHLYQWLEEKLHYLEEGYPDESDSDSHGNGSHEDRRYPGR